jgi:hypothetical protein
LLYILLTCLILLRAAQVMEIKNVKRASLKEYSSPTGVYVPGQRCWNVDDKAHIALPCATQV